LPAEPDAGNHHLLDRRRGRRLLENLAIPGDAQVADRRGPAPVLECRLDRHAFIRVQVDARETVDGPLTPDHEQGCGEKDREKRNGLLHGFPPQRGSGSGKELSAVFPDQQSPDPDVSQRRSAPGRGAIFGSGLPPFSSVTLFRISLWSGKGSMRGSRAAASGGSWAIRIPALSLPVTMLPAAVNPSPPTFSNPTPLGRTDIMSEGSVTGLGRLFARIRFCRTVTSFVTVSSRPGRTSTRTPAEFPMQRFKKTVTRTLFSTSIPTVLPRATLSRTTMVRDCPT